MRRGAKAALFLGLIVVFGFVTLSVWNQIGWIRDYGQAEPLVETIWPLAWEMKRFAAEHGRSPDSLDEIDRYSSDYDFSSLRAYPHQFTPTGPRRFFLRVNRRFAFGIDDQFAPNWIWPSKSRAETTVPAK